MYDVQAIAGDSLCSIAVREGFTHCGELLADNPNLAQRTVRQGDTIHIPQAKDRYFSGTVATGWRWTYRWTGRTALPPVPTVRFVRSHVTRRHTWNDQPQRLGISNYVAGFTNRAANAAMRDRTFRGHDGATAGDPHTYQVMVHAPGFTDDDLTVTLFPRRPTYENEQPTNRIVDFSDDEHQRRRLELTVSRERNDYFRSCYFRLVTDEVDQRAMPGQALLVTDLRSDENLEILDQKVHAVLPMAPCQRPWHLRCGGHREVPLERARTVRLSIHVLRAQRLGLTEVWANGAGDDGYVGLQGVEDRVRIFCRRVWAQAGVVPNLIRLETVDPPSDMLTVGDVPQADFAHDEDAATRRMGLDALGRPGLTGRSEVRLRLTHHRWIYADASYDVGPVAVTADATPAETAERLRRAIDRANVPDLAVEVSRNPDLAEFPGRYTVDVLLRPEDGWIRITGLTPVDQQDRDQKVLAVRCDVDPFPFRGSADHAHIGSPEQRNLIKSLGSRDPAVLDVFVLNQIPLNGHTIPATNRLAARLCPHDWMKNTLLLRAQAAGAVPEDITTTDLPYTLPHEIGHALMNNSGHDQNTIGSLLWPAATPLIRNVEDSKRVSDHASNGFGAVAIVRHQYPEDGYLGERPATLNLMQEVQANGSGLLHNARQARDYRTELDP